MCSIICFVKLNPPPRGKIVLRKYARERVYFSARILTNETRRRRFPGIFMGICSHIYIPLETGETSSIVRERCRVDQSKCTDGRNARGGKSNIIVEREW